MRLYTILIYDPPIDNRHALLVGLAGYLTDHFLNRLLGHFLHIHLVSGNPHIT